MNIKPKPSIVHLYKTGYPMVIDWDDVAWISEDPKTGFIRLYRPKTYDLVVKESYVECINLMNKAYKFTLWDKFKVVSGTAWKAFMKSLRGTK